MKEGTLRVFTTEPSQQILLSRINGEEEEPTSTSHIDTVTMKEIRDRGDKTSVKPPNLEFPRMKPEAISRGGRTSNGFGSGEARSRPDWDTQNDEEETRTGPNPELVERKGRGEQSVDFA